MQFDYALCKIRKYGIVITQCVTNGGIMMEVKEKIKELRESTGMNRREFCDYFGIPYRTVTEWELGNRKMPDYVLRMMEYQVQMEKLYKKAKPSKKEDKLN